MTLAATILRFADGEVNITGWGWLIVWILAPAVVSTYRGRR